MHGDLVLLRIGVHERKELVSVDLSTKLSIFGVSSIKVGIVNTHIPIYNGPID